jgi:hypothetical protein
MHELDGVGKALTQKVERFQGITFHLVHDLIDTLGLLACRHRIPTNTECPATAVGAEPAFPGQTAVLQLHKESSLVIYPAKAMFSRYSTAKLPG